MKKYLVLLFLFVASLTHAGGFDYLNDPLVTPATLTDRLILYADTVNATQNSIPFTAQAGQTNGSFTFNVTACSSCNLTFQVEIQDSDGTWFAYQGAVAITATTATPARYSFGSSSVVTTTAYTLSLVRVIPPIFRISVLFNSGTSASYTVAGMIW